VGEILSTKRKGKSSTKTGGAKKKKEGSSGFEKRSENFTKGANFIRGFQRDEFPFEKWVRIPLLGSKKGEGKKKGGKKQIRSHFEQ